MNIYELLEAFGTFIEIFLILSITDAFAFERRIKNKVKHNILKIILTLSYTVFVVWYLNRIELFSYVTLGISVTIILIMSQILYRIQILKAAAVPIIYFTITGAIGFLILALIELLGGMVNITIETAFNMGPVRAVFILTVKALEIIGYLIFKKMKRGENQKSKTRNLIAVCIAAVFCLLCMNFLMGAITSDDIKTVKLSVLIAWMFMVLFLIGGVITLNFINKQNQKRREYELVELQRSMLEENYNKINDLYQKNAKNFHDFKNHVSTINRMLKVENYSKAESYVEELDDIAYSSPVTFYTGVDIVDAVLNNKVQEAKDKDIQITVQAVYLNDTRIKSVDICAILANLLDNAIEACIKIEDKDKRYIDIVINCTTSVVVVKIINSIGEKPVKEKGRLITSKKAKGLHGYGLPSVKSSLKKYDGSISQEYTDKVFKTTVGMYI